MRFPPLLIAALMAACCSGCQTLLPEMGNKGLASANSARLARATLTGGDAAGAISLFEAALRTTPDDYNSRLGLAEAQFRAGDLDSARVNFTKAAALRPDALDPVLTLARIATLQRHLDEACRRYSDARSRADRSDPRPLVGLGAVYDLEGDPGKAQALYREALDARPDDLAARNNLGLSLALSGHPRQAVEVLLDLSRNPAAPPQTRQNLALAYGVMGNRQASESVLLSGDLDARAVQTNLAYYDMLRHRLSAPASGGDARP